MPEKIHRTIRSFVRREGRFTPAQRRAFDLLWDRFGLEPQQQPYNFDEVFGRSAPRRLEIGIGNGEALALMAADSPGVDFLGIEVHRPGVGRLLRRIDEAGLSNVRVMTHDAVELLRDCIPENSLEKTMLFFPDPWPKKKHHKRRIVDNHFLNLIGRALQADGLLHMATDWEDYAEHMQIVLNAREDYTSVDANFSPRPETHFERRGKRLGHGVWDLVYRVSH